MILWIFLGVFAFFVGKVVLFPWLRIRSLLKTLPHDHHYLGFFPVMGEYIRRLVAYNHYQKFRDQLHQLSKGTRFMVTNLGTYANYLIYGKDLLREYSAQSDKFVKADPVKSLLLQYLGQGLLLKEGEAHKVNRKLISQILNFNFINSKAEAIDLVVDKMIKDIVPGKPTIVRQKLFMTTSKIIAQCFCKVSDFSGTIQGKTIFQYFVDLTTNNLQKQFANPVRILTGLSTNSQWKKSLANVNAFIGQIVERQVASIGKADPSDRNLIHLLYQNTPGTHEQRKLEIISQFKTFVLAGFESTSNILTMFFYYLDKRRDFKPLIKKEAEQYFASGAAPSINSGKQLVYLNAFINQILRHYTGFSTTIGRKATEDLYLGDLYVPKDTRITIMNELVHRDENVFENPSEFKPQRWIGFQPPAYSLVAFHFGTRNCIGQHLALMQMRLIIMRIISKYDFDLPTNFNQKMVLRAAAEFVTPLQVTFKEWQ